MFNQSLDYLLFEKVTDLGDYLKQVEIK